MFLLYTNLNPNVQQMPRSHTILDDVFFSALNVRHNVGVPIKYFISLSSFSQSTWLGYFTLVHKNEILGWISGLALLHYKNPIAKVLWNNSYLLFFRGLIPSAFNRFSVAGNFTLLKIHQSYFSHTFSYPYLLLLL